MAVIHANFAAAETSHHPPSPKKRSVAVIHANFVTAGASSHWLMGAQLMATYVLIAMTFLFR